MATASPGSAHLLAGKSRKQTELDLFHRSPALWPLHKPQARPSSPSGLSTPVPAGPRAPSRSQERTVEREMRRANPSAPNTPSTQSARIPGLPHRPPHPSRTTAQAHHPAGALQAGQAEHQEPLEQCHVPVRDRKPQLPPCPHACHGISPTQFTGSSPSFPLMEHYELPHTLSLAVGLSLRGGTSPLNCFPPLCFWFFTFHPLNVLVRGGK